MTVLGGHQPHDDSDINTISPSEKNTVYGKYKKNNDIAIQLKDKEPIKDYCDLNISHKNHGFLTKFMSNIKKWVSKEAIEVD